jgi:diaminopimelate epimerase
MWQNIPFWKMTGSGNDFIVIDNRTGLVDSDRCQDLVRLACRRKLSVGADGLILIENDSEVDFQWRFFNADGSEAEMCGNGARCAARFAFLNAIVQSDRMRFRTIAGVIEAQIIGDRVRIQTTPPRNLELDVPLHVDHEPFRVHFVSTGVPHTVLIMEHDRQLAETDVERWGQALRTHDHFQPAGTNVNFIHVSDEHRLTVRTYERGVEAETLACGTGSIASAIVAAAKGLAISPVDVQTMSGETLTVHFADHGGQFQDVHLEGAARVVYEAKLWAETVQV